MTYLEIGPDTRVRTEVIPSADGIEYAKVNHTQPKKNKNDVGKFSISLGNWYLNLGSIFNRQVFELGYFVNSSPLSSDSSVA